MALEQQITEMWESGSLDPAVVEEAIAQFQAELTAAAPALAAVLEEPVEEPAPSARLTAAREAVAALSLRDRHTLLTELRLEDAGFVAPAGGAARRLAEAARTAGLSGKVMLKLLVAVDGSVKQVQVESSEPAGVFDQAAVDAASKWHFSNGSRDSDGKPVEGWVRVPVQFAPEQPAH